MSSSKHAHLEMIQGVVNRLSHNSYHRQKLLTDMSPISHADGIRHMCISPIPPFSNRSVSILHR